jgi:hypothetical protein
MKTEVKGQPFAIFFSYGTLQEKQPRRFVKCWICPEREQQEEKVQPIGVGIAVCSPQDNFCKVLGRKRAFARALAEAGFDRETRSDLWSSFKNTHRYKI